MPKRKYISLAKDVINLEIKALQSLRKNLNNSFNNAVNEIIKCQSKVILCGVGKSGLIASKIAATLASVGTPSFSISASEASHGDLGMISKKDILILISNSGETSELKNIIQYAKRNKILNDAFARDPEFFEFIRSMEAYSDTFKDGTTTMVISPDSDFFEYFENSEGSN